MLKLLFTVTPSTALKAVAPETPGHLSVACMRGWSSGPFPLLFFIGYHAIAVPISHEKSWTTGTPELIAIKEEALKYTVMIKFLPGKDLN